VPKEAAIKIWHPGFPLFCHISLEREDALMSLPDRLLEEDDEGPEAGDCTGEPL